MDIPDIELVVVNGPPATLSQLYQVNKLLNVPYFTYAVMVRFFLLRQMFGRAGRNGAPARAHLLYTSRQIKQIKDPSLSQFCGDACKENCRRQQLLISLGSKESIQGNAACCDDCTGGKVLSARLDVLVPPSLKRARKSKPVRDVNKNMEQMVREGLLKDKDKILEECPGFRILGGNFILSDAVIEELCLKAPFIESKSDLNGVLLLRPEHHERVFKVIWHVVSSAPPPPKKHRKK